MSVLIKGMDMPCSCYDCPLTKVTELKLEKDAFVSIENGGVVYFQESEEA